MDAREAAARLDGSEYREEGSPALFSEMKEHGLVAVFGASDDLMEFRGAVDDEMGAGNGAMAWFTPRGLLVNDCDDDRCPHFERARKQAAAVKALWNSDGWSWRYETFIPHFKFAVMEDGERYCEGIVFALEDVPA